MKRRNNTAAENAVRAKAPCTLDQETRDLLTRAASAADIRVVEWVGDQANVEMDGGHCGWNPLASWGKGEALSLVVKLRLGLIPLEGGGWDVERFDERGIGRTLASCANSGAWALQEAVVRAAATLSTRSVDSVHGWLFTTENVSDAEAAQSVLTGRTLEEIQRDIDGVMRRIDSAAGVKEDQHG